LRIAVLSHRVAMNLFKCLIPIGLCFVVDDDEPPPQRQFSKGTRRSLWNPYYKMLIKEIIIV
jgi:hypothetical protein